MSRHASQDGPGPATVCDRLVTALLKGGEKKPRTVGQPSGISAWTNVNSEGRLLTVSLADQRREAREQVVVKSWCSRSTRSRLGAKCSQSQ